MEIIKLEKFEKPRILLLDFKQSEVDRLQQEGFNAKRGASGVIDKDMFFMPWSFHDIEIAFINITNNTFNFEKRKPAVDTVEEEPNYHKLIDEIIHKLGHLVFFIDNNCTPNEFEQIYLSGMGIIDYKGSYIDVNEYNTFCRKLDEEPYSKKDNKVPTTLKPKFIKLKTQELIFDESEISKICKVNLNSIDAVRIKARPEQKINMPREYMYRDTLITDNSSVKCVIAERWCKQEKDKKGSIIFLPDFRENNITVASKLLKHVIMNENPSLFEGIEPNWRANYLAKPIKTMIDAYHEKEDENKQQLKQLENQIDLEIGKYYWLIKILFEQSDALVNSVIDAFAFLDIKAENVDKTLKVGEKKKEDLRLFNIDGSFFAICEVKSTKRGASEDFINLTQQHQSRYSKENKVQIPKAILIINHSIEIDPSLRVDRFYRDQSLLDRLCDAQILAIDTTILYKVCQSAFNDSKYKDDFKSKLINDVGVLSA